MLTDVHDDFRKPVLVTKLETLLTNAPHEAYINLLLHINYFYFTLWFPQMSQEKVKLSSFSKFTL